MILGKRKKGSKEDNQDRYLITYADVITLLLGLFVILYASSQVDTEKYKEVSKALSSVFSEDKNFDAGDGILEGSKKNIPLPELPNKSSQMSLDKLAEKAEVSLSGYISRGEIELRREKSEIVVTMPEQLLFKSGKSEVQFSAQPVLDTLAIILRSIKFQITVDGHTDDIPIRTFQYESNWHLSTARAVNIGYALIRKGVPEQNMVMRGFGAQKPITDNSDEQRRAKNRRVEITISDLPVDVPSDDGYSKIDSF